MNTRSFRLTLPLLLFIMTAWLPAEVHAVANGSVSVIAPPAVKLSLLSKSNNTVVAAGDGELVAKDLAPGTYTVSTQVGSEPAKTSDIVVETDKDCRYQVDTDTGKAERIRCIGLLVMAQQQYPWTFGLLAGWKQTPFNARLDTTFGNGDTELEEDGYSLSLEARYNFRRRQQSLGANLFLYGAYVHYFGTEAERLFLNDHVADPALDTGAGVEEHNALHLGIGSHWNIAQRLGFELMLGVHATRVTGTLTTLESQGGGSDLVFKRDKTLLGPMLALGLTYHLFNLGCVRKPCC
jgi:hypothetical protein